MYQFTEGVATAQPREKAIKYGINYLSDRELIAIILGSGTKENPIKKLSAQILKLIDLKNGTLSIDELVKIKGIGEAKATLISASLEFSRRILKPSITKVTYPTDILPAVRHFVTRNQEYFIAISLNGAHEIIKTSVISIGLLNRTLIHPREVFADALQDRSASLIITHNHPSGNLTPSNEDIEVTKRLIDAGELLGINVLDHIIFSETNYFSFKENSLI
ncbi:MAG: hypothetical protein B6229_06320 [Spirochaetaceae bacterium 4572_7]|nr:MAG: hypothetical protein B6229_06320 [Spirochaetaceae bacterium 4572_7]